MDFTAITLVCMAAVSQPAKTDTLLTALSPRTAVLILKPSGKPTGFPLPKAESKSRHQGQEAHASCLNSLWVPVPLASVATSKSLSTLSGGLGVSARNAFSLTTHLCPRVLQRRLPWPSKDLMHSSIHATLRKFV